MAHYTPKFTAAWNRVLDVIAKEGEEAGKVAFRDEMLALGHVERVRNLYRISNKLSNKAEFFLPNPPQENYLKNKSGRDIVLKTRQVGFTTLSAVRGLDYALWEPNMKTGIMAHLQLTVGTIFTDLVKFTYEWFKRDWGHLYAPTEKSSNTTELAFKDDGLGRALDSSMRVLYDFRGKTVNFLHVSEASRVEDERLLGSLQGVPVNGEVILESTPHGRGGQFYRLWNSFKTNGKTAPYQGFFIPWFDFYPELPDSWKEAEEGVKWTPYEEDLLKADLKPYHLLWRRWCIEANCNGDPDQFENEYPSNDRDCFLTGEFAVYPNAILKAQDKNTREPSYIGFLIADGAKIEFHDDGKGCLAIWTKPDPAKTYVIGADPSGGVGKDKAAAYVKCRETKAIVARIWGDLEPADFGRELYKAGKFYNNAWICVESNNHGGTVLHVLKERSYFNLYKRAVIDEMTNKPTKKLGFLTTNDQKLRITEKLKVSCKNGDLKIVDSQLIDEMSRFCQISSKTGRGIRREAAPGSHDDLVMAACLTEEMDQSRGEIDTKAEQSEYQNEDFDRLTGF
jgi:hypothetical protein